MRIFIRLIVALGLMGWGQFVFAVDYYWVYSGKAGKYPSAFQACEKSAIKEGYDGGRIGSLVTGPGFNTPTFQCFFKSGSGEVEKNHVVRSGDSCPSETIYNPQTGECEAPEPEKCEPTIGNIITHQHKLGPIGGASTPPPGSICENECQYAFTDTPPKDVYRFVDPDPAQRDNAYGAYTYKGNGVECTGGPSNFDQPPTVPPIDKKPELSHEQKCDQWVTGADGVTRRTCTSKDEYKNPGQLKCEDTNGYLKCTAGNPPPDYQQTNKTEETKKETNADGSTTTETNTTTDKTTCKGAKPCTSTSADEKETSGTNPDGTPGDGEKECTGTGCKPADKDNDGIPDDEEAEEGEERTATLGSCDAPVSCSGDAIDCAVLQEEKSQRCLAEENSDYPKYKSEVESQLTEDKYQLEKETVQVPGLLQGSTRFLPSSCPPPKSVSLSGGKNITLEFDLFCNFASGIAPVIVALALLFGALYVGRSFGGG